MCPNGSERKLAAILSADVVGYSRLMADDESATIRTLADYREEIAVLIRQHRGRVVDTAGDSLLAEFPTATDAVSCAVETQGVLKVRNAAVLQDRKMEFRIGVHLGEVRVEGDRIYGDGVNIAARLEALADPGGICISGTVHDQVERKLELRCEDLGEQSLKNIPKPVPVFRVRIGAEPGAAKAEPRPRSRVLVVAGVLLVLVAGSWALWNLAGDRSTSPEAAISEERLTAEELSVPGFSGAPAIAVLPFDNLSGDPEQEYFADGMAEDLITRISAWRWFPVIARNSSFVYKGQAVDVKQVSRELGVRYVVEGSVRKGGDRIRISAQLIDATTGHHVWAESYDRELRDIFAVQDEISESIVMAMRPELRRSERERAARREPRDLRAYDLTQRGWWYLAKSTADDNLRARSLFEQAIEQDPSYADAWSALALAHFRDVLQQWTNSPARSSSELQRAARRSVSLDPQWARGHVALAAAQSLAGNRDEAIASAERAVELDPSLPMAYRILGVLIAVAGRPDDGVAKIETGMRLDPRDPSIWRGLQNLAIAHLVAERFAEAVDAAQRSLQNNPDDHSTHALLAVSYAHLGRIDEARSAFREVLRLQPGFSLAGVRQMFAGANEDFVERIVAGLRKAGLKE